MAPPKRMTLGQIPAYVDRVHGIEITRQTAYNWAKKGLKGDKLHTIRKAGHLYTTERAVDEFLDKRG